MKTIRIILICAACVAVTSTAAGAASRALSLAAGSNTTAAGNSFLPTFATKASRVTFVSHANNLVTNDNAGLWMDVFVRDCRSNTTVLASVSTNGFGGGDHDSAWASISANGRFVAFASLAGNLITGDSNSAYDVFVRDLDAGITRLVSVDLNGSAPADPNPISNIPLSGNPMISTDGDQVFFESRATNLTAAVTSTNSVNIYLRNLLSNSTSLVSFDTNGSPFNNFCELTSVSTNGQLAAFVTRSTESRFSGSGDVYVRNLTSSTTIHASAAVAAYAPSYRCDDARLTPDGQFLVYIAGGLPEGTVLFRYQFSTSTTIPVATNVLEHSTPQISTTGRYITFTDGTNVFRWDANTGSKVLVNANLSGTTPANGQARHPVASSDADTILFVSNSSDLTTDNSTNLQIYARNVSAGTTRLLTVSTSGGVSAGVDFFTVPSITPGGTHAAFDTTAPDLIYADANAASDAFWFQLVDGPFIWITRLAGADVELKWATVPLATYEIEYKETVDGSFWTKLSSPIALTGGFATSVDSTTNGPTRFYRVLETR